MGRRLSFVGWKESKEGSADGEASRWRQVATESECGEGNNRVSQEYRKIFVTGADGESLSIVLSQSGYPYHTRIKTDVGIL